ncbi:hypothetical protein ACFLXQ_03660 [Chloroflexota bacterium]
MKLLKSLNQPADNCIILTYNLDLLFFEYMLYPSLYASGCRNTMILCDPTQYEFALQYDVARLQYVGQRYLLVPARTSLSGAFHPKLILLTSANGGSLFLLSGNLTKAGYLHNWEVLTLFEYNTKKPDPIAWQACRWAIDTLSEIIKVSDVGSLGHERLEQLWGTTPWLHQEPPIASTTSVWPLHNLSEPLLDQVLTRYRQEDGSPVNEVIVISPFFDAKARAIERLLKELQPKKMQLHSQAEGHGLNPDQLKLVLTRHHPEFQAYELSLGNRRLHAKTLLLRTEQGVWLATGSANLSRSAWLRSAASGNTEIISLRFEQYPGYFDAWLQELTDQAAPIDLDEIEPFEPETSPNESKHRLTLLSAILDQHHLELHLSESLPLKASLNLRLLGEETLQKVYKRWQQRDDHSIILNLDPDWLSQVSRPILLQLEIETDSNRFISNPVLLHNKVALERSRRPVNRRERPPIPIGMQPESYAHCAALLDMLQDLLATNKDQLNRHRGTIPAAIKKRDKQEQQQAIEEDDYDPEAHFVDEEFRRPISTGGSDLYTNFYDRLTYEELLKAVLAAVYHPEKDPAPGADDRPITIPVPNPTPSPDDETLKERMLARIEYGFSRLVDNFLQGIADDEYLQEVPPYYLVELFVILTSYLRIVWRDGMLKDAPFLNHSIDLVGAFWGQAGEFGAWQALRPHLSDEDLNHFEEKLALSAQTWLHTYSVINQLDQTNDSRIFDGAAWVRHLQTVLTPPDILTTLAEQTYEHLWRFSQPVAVQFISAAEVVAYLHNVSRMYNEDTLKAEIQTWPNTKASLFTGSIAGLSRVPMLQIKRPLVDMDLDLFLETFLLFLQWPHPKPTAWVRFENANPLEDDDEVYSVVIFYRDDQKSLICDVVRKSGESRPMLTLERVTVDDLPIIQSFAELQILAE